MLNKAQLIGFLGADPDVRFTQEQEAIARVRIATSETWKKDGKRQEKTEWHNVVFFGKLAEIVGDHLKKGSLVFVEGRLQTRSWEKDGETRYSTEIVAEPMPAESFSGYPIERSTPTASDGGKPAMSGPTRCSRAPRRWRGCRPRGTSSRRARP